MFRRTLYVWLGVASLALASDPSRPGVWKPHDPRHPQPQWVRPARGAEPPSDAVVLFNGLDLSEWVDNRGQAPHWRIGEGYFESVPGAGSLRTRRAFGNCQVHLEWRVPEAPGGEGQARGNSGVKLMGLYEVQVLDSFRNPTYADGVAGAIYAERPPLVNPSLQPGEWQVFDIIFHAPRFGADGRQIRPATVTVLYNGLVVQDHASISGPTGLNDYGQRPPVKPHPGRLPLLLQEHASTVRFRNIWIRELPE